MLLQIHEPGETPQEDITVGIDFGTTNCVVSYVRDGQPEIVPIDQHRLMPSAISYGASTVVGRAAVPLDQTIFSVKRYLDPGFAEVFPLPFEMAAPGEEGLPRFLVGGRERSPVDISRDLLQYLRQKTEETLGHPVYQAVITVPAYYTERARLATRKAATEAGIRVLRLLNEPTAAALAYRLDEKGEGHYLVYDFGGGTFDVSLLYLEKGVFQVLAVGGDTALGGDDVDAAFAQYLMGQFDLKDPQACRRYAQEIKEGLSEKEVWEGTLQNKQISVSRAALAEVAAPFVERSLQICDRTLQDAGVEKEDLKNIVLVGGSTRLLSLRQQVADHFQQKPLCDLNPDEVVALGAALQAEALVTGTGKLLLDVTPHSLGIETLGGAAEVLIPRNATLPCAMSQTFTTSIDGQKRIKIRVFQGEEAHVDDCKTLACFVLSGIPEMPAGEPSIKVSFSLDADGILSVEAKEEKTGLKQTIHVQAALSADL